MLIAIVSQHKLHEIILENRVTNNSIDFERIVTSSYLRFFFGSIKSFKILTSLYLVLIYERENFQFLLIKYTRLIWLQWPKVCLTWLGFHHTLWFHDKTLKRDPLNFHSRSSNPSIYPYIVSDVKKNDNCISIIRRRL